MADAIVLLATDRPAIHLFLRCVWSAEDGARLVGPMPVAASALAGRDDDVAGATAAIIDVGSDPAAAIELCQQLRSRWPALLSIALVCCPHALTVWQLRTLTLACDGVLDMNAAEDELRRALRSVARGNAVFHIDLGRPVRSGVGGGSLNGHAHARDGWASSETDGKILDLVARGLSDREIARELHLSPHTIGHHIDRLCTRMGVKNRVALAAWAGRHGYYQPPVAS